MISIIIPTLNAARTLGPSLASLLEANKLGYITDVIISDGGSTDETLAIADAAGAKIVEGEKGRGGQLIRGAAKAKGEWLLFLHADTQLSPGWEAAVEPHIRHAYDRQAAVFELKFDADGFKPWLVAFGANLRSRILGLPYGDQGLLISRRHYDRLGGFRPYPLFEDVDLVRRITKEGGRSALSILNALAITSPERYVREGYALRVIRNARLMAAFKAGVAPEILAERYNARIRKTSRPHGQTALDGPRQNPPQP